MKQVDIALIFGGKSTEHEVSIESAKSVANIISRIKKYKLHLFFVDKNNIWYEVDKNFFNKSVLKKKIIFDLEKGFISGNKKIKLDAVFPLIHGNTGEDGKIQGLLELMDIPYVGCDVLSSAIGMNKKISKLIAHLSQIPILEDLIVNKKYLNDNFRELEIKAEKLGYPVFVKPVSLGSSVGVIKIKNRNELKKGLISALKYDREIMIEKGLERPKEIVCALLGDYEEVKASHCGEVIIKGSHDFYDYNAKYIDNNAMELAIPAKISDEQAKKIQEYSIKMFKAIKGYGLARADFFIDSKNKIYFCEINTIPGFTSHSLYPRLWEYSKIKNTELVDKLISLAIKRKKENDKLKKMI